ncbi:MAG: secretin N-terminal domain-containing protein [Sphingomonas sp.]
MSNPVARALSAGAGGANRFQRQINSPIASLAANNLATNAAAAAALSGQAGGTPQAGGAGQMQPGGGEAKMPQGFSTPDLTIQPAPELNAIVVRGTPSAIASIEPLITDLDIRRPQVQIEAAIAEITGDDAEQLGIQLGSNGAALTSGTGAATSFTTAGPSLGQILTVLGVPAGAILGNASPEISRSPTISRCSSRRSAPRPRPISCRCRR